MMLTISRSLTPSNIAIPPKTVATPKVMPERKRGNGRALARMASVVKNIVVRPAAMNRLPTIIRLIIFFFIKT